MNVACELARGEMLTFSLLLLCQMGPENGGTITIRTDSMELAGDIIQDLCRYLKIENLESLADFPAEMETFQGVLTRVEEYNAQRLKMSADIADSSNLVKTLVIKAEDSRILNEMNQMGKYYSQLYDVSDRRGARGPATNRLRCTCTVRGC
jgi:hypothetical protein